MTSACATPIGRSSSPTRWPPAFGEAQPGPLRARAPASPSSAPTTSARTRGALLHAGGGDARPRGDDAGARAARGAAARPYARARPGSSRVTFAPFRSPPQAVKAVIGVMRSAELVCLPSRSESFGPGDDRGARCRGAGRRLRAHPPRDQRTDGHRCRRAGRRADARQRRGRDRVGPLAWLGSASACGGRRWRSSRPSQSAQALREVAARSSADRDTERRSARPVRTSANSHGLSSTADSRRGAGARLSAPGETGSNGRSRGTAAGTTGLWGLDPRKVITHAGKEMARGGHLPAGDAGDDAPARARRGASIRGTRMRSRSATDPAGWTAGTSSEGLCVPVLLCPAITNSIRVARRARERRIPPHRARQPDRRRRHVDRHVHRSGVQVPRRRRGRPGRGPGSAQPPRRRGRAARHLRQRSDLHGPAQEPVGRPERGVDQRRSTSTARRSGARFRPSRSTRDRCRWATATASRSSRGSNRVPRWSPAASPTTRSRG